MSDAVSPYAHFVSSYQSGEIIFREGEPGSTMYVVHSGRVQLYRDADGQYQSVAVLEKGDFFGEMSLLEAMPRSCSARMADDGELIVVNAGTFDRMLRSDPEVSVRMLRALSRRIRRMTQQLANLRARAGNPSRSGGGGGRRSDPQESPTDRLAVLRPESGEPFYLRNLESVVGRGDPAVGTRPDVDLTELDAGRRSTSRRHARINRTGGVHFLIEEVGVVNGTYVNGRKVEPGLPVPLHHGDRVQFGAVALSFELIQDTGPAPVAEPDGADVTGESDAVEPDQVDAVDKGES